MATSTTITLTRGDTFDANVARWTVLREGTPLDITGWTARLYILDSDGVAVLDVDDSGAAGSRVTIPTGSDGVIDPDVEADITELFPVGGHRYDLEITSPTGEVITVVRQGKFTVKEDIAI